MKKFIILIIFTNFNFLFSQNLKLSEILNFRNNDLSQVEEYLSKNDWNYFDREDMGNGKSKIIFSYQQTEYGKSAKSFIDLYLDSKNSVDWIIMQIHKNQIYIEYLNSVKNLGCKLIQSRVNIEGKIEKIYQGKTTTFIFQIQDNSTNLYGAKNIYQLIIIPNSDFSKFK